MHPIYIWKRKREKKGKLNVNALNIVNYTGLYGHNTNLYIRVFSGTKHKSSLFDAPMNISEV